MNIWKTLLLALAPAVAFASVCDETYYLQSVSQSIYTGTDPKNLGNARKSVLGPDLAGIEILDSNIAYNLLSKFESSCFKAAKPVTFKSRGIRKSAFVDSVATDYHVQMFDAKTRVEDLEYYLWAGFFKPDSVLKFTVGKKDSTSSRFENWYVGLTYKDSVPAGALSWSVTTGYYALSGPDDSLVLEKRVLDQTIRKLTLESTHRYSFTVQFLKVSFDSQLPTGIRAARKKTVSAFQASQSGNLVLIQPGGKDAEKGAVSSEPLSLYGMMGNKITTLHPTGYLYQWNGRTATGAEAPTGVYFVQSGNRILGKFFYTR